MHHVGPHASTWPAAVDHWIELRLPGAESVDRLRRVHPRPEDDDRSDTTEIGEMALENVQGDAGRDAGVDRVAATLEHTRAGERRQVMAGAHHVARREKCGPALGDGDRRIGALDRDLAHKQTLLGTLDRCGSSNGVFRRTTTARTSWSTIVARPS